MNGRLLFLSIFQIQILEHHKSDAQGNGRDGSAIQTRNTTGNSLRGGAKKCGYRQLGAEARTTTMGREFQCCEGMRMTMLYSYEA